MADLEVGGLHHMSAITRDVAERAALLSPSGQTIRNGGSK